MEDEARRRRRRRVPAAHRVPAALRPASQPPNVLHLHAARRLPCSGAARRGRLRGPSGSSGEQLRAWPGGEVLRRRPSREELGGGEELRRRPGGEELGDEEEPRRRPGGEEPDGAVEEARSRARGERIRACRAFAEREQSSIFGGCRRPYAKRDREGGRMEKPLEGSFCPFFHLFLFFYR